MRSKTQDFQNSLKLVVILAQVPAATARGVFWYIRIQCGDCLVWHVVLGSWGSRAWIKEQWMTFRKLCKNRVPLASLLCPICSGFDGSLLAAVSACTTTCTNLCWSCQSSDFTDSLVEPYFHLKLLIFGFKKLWRTMVSPWSVWANCWCSLMAELLTIGFSATRGVSLTATLLRLKQKLVPSSAMLQSLIKSSFSHLHI